MQFLCLVAFLTFEHGLAVHAFQKSFREGSDESLAPDGSIESLVQQGRVLPRVGDSVLALGDKDSPFAHEASKRCNFETSPEWAEYKKFHAQCRKDYQCRKRALIYYE